MTNDRKPGESEVGMDQADMIRRTASILQVSWTVLLGSLAAYFAWRSNDSPGLLSVGLASIALFCIGGSRPLLGGALVAACGLLEWWAWSGTNGGTPVPAPLVTLLLPVLLMTALELWRPAHIDLDIADRMESQSARLPRMLVLATPIMLVWMIALGRSL